MPQVFISYSSKSKDLVTMLSQDLETAGYQIWFDHKLTGGQGWWDQILENIRRCDLFVFALTPDALESAACQLEYFYSFNLKKNILPILMADGVAVNQLPAELSVIQYVDYRAKDRVAALRLMNAIHSLPAPLPLPDPLPKAPDAPISEIGHLRKQIDTLAPLSFEEQAALLFKLKAQLQTDNSPQDGVFLLERLQKRRDLFANIDKEINAILSSYSVTPAPAFTPVTYAAPQPIAQTPQRPIQEEIAPSKIMVSEAPQNNIPERESRRKSALMLFVISTIIIWALPAIFIPPLFLDYQFVYAVICSLIHGIIGNFTLRSLEALPQKPISLGWILSSVFTGGPLNGLLLRRIVPSIKTYQILIVVISWIINALIFRNVIMDWNYNRAIFLENNIYYGTIAIIGGSIGFVGSLITLGMLAIVRYQSKR